MNWKRLLGGLMVGGFFTSILYMMAVGMGLGWPFAIGLFVLAAGAALLVVVGVGLLVGAI